MLVAKEIGPYRVVERLGKRARGTVHAVERRFRGEREAPSDVRHANIGSISLSAARMAGSVAGTAPGPAALRGRDAAREATEAGLPAADTEVSKRGPIVRRRGARRGRDGRPRRARAPMRSSASLLLAAAVATSSCALPSFSPDDFACDACADATSPPDAAPDASSAPDGAPDAGLRPDATPDAGSRPDATPDAGSRPDATPDAGARADTGPDVGSAADAAPDSGAGLDAAIDAGSGADALAAGAPAPLLSTDLAVTTTVSSAPLAAFAGSRYLVVWSAAEVFGQLFETSGAPVAPAFAIASGAGARTVAGVAASGARFLVVWVDGSASPAVLRGRLVSTGGALLGSELAITPVAARVRGTNKDSVACTTTTCLVVWADGRAGADFADIHGQIVSTIGDTVARQGSDFRISPTTEFQDDAAVEAGGTTYLVTWTNATIVNGSPTDVHGALVSFGGTPASPFAISTAPGSQGGRTAGIAFDGTTFLVVFDDDRDRRPGYTTDHDVHGARVSESGALLDGAPAGGGIWIANDPGDTTPLEPKVTFDGTDWLVVFPGTRGKTSGVRVARPGALLDTTPFFLSANAAAPLSSDWHAAPAAVSGGSTSLVVWQRIAPSPSAVGAQLVSVPPSPANVPPIADAGPDPTGTVGAPIMLDASASRDPDGTTPLSYAWQLRTFPGSSDPRFSCQTTARSCASAPGNATPTFTADVAGTYVIELVVTDALGARSLVDVLIVTVQ